MTFGTLKRKTPSARVRARLADDDDNLEVMVGEVKEVEVAVKGKSSTILSTHQTAHHFVISYDRMIMMSHGIICCYILS